jgi:hypothetical protein
VPNQNHSDACIHASIVNITAPLKIDCHMGGFLGTM